MSDSHDERLKKLIDRTNEPLPNYSSEGIKGGGKINFEETVSEGREVVSKELFSDKKSKKLAEMDSHRKAVVTNRREEPSRHQTTLDAFNFYLKPNIELKKVKRVYSDSNNMDMLAELNSNESNSNQSSRDARELFSNGGKQLDKIDQFISMQPAVCNSESKGFKCPEDYSQYVLREKREYTEQLERYQSIVNHLKQENAQKNLEIKRLKENLENMQQAMATFEYNKNRICSIVLELESLRSIQKRTELASMKIKLGHIESTNSLGGNKSENKTFWVDGIDFLARKKALEQIAVRRTLLENYKRSVKMSRRMSNGDQQAAAYDEYGEDEMLFTYLMKEDPKESAKRLDDVIARLNNEEKEIHDQLEKLESERVRMVQLERTMIDETK